MPRMEPAKTIAGLSSVLRCSNTAPLTMPTTLQPRAVSKNEVRRELLCGCNAATTHRQSQFLAEDIKHAFYAVLPKRRQAPKIGSADTNSACSKGQCFENIAAATESAVNKNRYLCTNGVDDLGQDVDCSPASFRRAPTMVRDYDSVSAMITRQHRILGCVDSLKN